MTPRRKPTSWWSSGRPLTFAWSPHDWVVLAIVAIVGIMVHVEVVREGANRTAAQCANLFMTSPEHVALLNELAELHSEVEHARQESHELSAILIQVQASMSQVDAGLTARNREHQQILAAIRAARERRQ